MDLVLHLAVDWMCIEGVECLFQLYCSSLHIDTIDLIIDNFFTCNSNTSLLRTFYRP